MRDFYLSQLVERFMDANGGEEDDVIREIKALGETLDEDASLEEVTEAVDEILKRHLAESISEDDDEEEVDNAYMEDACNVVRAFLDENDWHYRFNKKRPDFAVFDLGFTIKGCSLTARIHVEDNPKVCCIDAVLPITADPTYEYIVCKELARLNYSKRFGAFKHDERDGEITYEYTFQIGGGIDPEELETAFHAVVQTAANGYPDIRKCCVGKFKSSEVSEILSKLEAIVTDLGEE